MHCLLCRGVFSEVDELEGIDNKTPFSKKPICGIIIYLAQKSKPIDVSWLNQPYEQQICKTCLGDILAYDEYMVKILEVQKRIVFCLRNLKVNDDEYIDAFDEQVEKVEISFQHESYIKPETDSVPATDEPEHQGDAGSYSQEIENADHKFEDLKYALDESQNAIHSFTVNGRHNKVVHNLPTKICKCDICGVVTKDEEYLELHMNIHDGKSDLECRYCNKQYTRRINVIRHMQKHWDKKKFQCERCGLRFSERPMYYNHRLQHDAEEDPLICSVCNQSFKTRRTYRNHLWTHREDRPRFGCEVCGKTFVERYTLKVHLRCHTEKEAANTDGRRKYSKLQEEKKPCKCIICGNLFLTRDSVDHHMKVEHDVILKAENIFV